MSPPIQIQMTHKLEDTMKIQDGIGSDMHDLWVWCHKETIKLSNTQEIAAKFECTEDVLMWCRKHASQTHPPPNGFWGSREQIVLLNALARFIRFRHNPCLLAPLFLCPRSFPSPRDNVVVWALFECRRWCKTIGVHMNDLDVKIGSTVLVKSIKFHHSKRYAVKKMSGGGYS